MDGDANVMINHLDGNNFEVEIKAPLTQPTGPQEYELVFSSIMTSISTQEIIAVVVQWECSTSPRGVIEQTGTPNTYMLYDLVMDINSTKKQPYDVQKGLYPLGCFTSTTTIVKSFFN